jgi:choloylglycine hydrolase
MQLKTNIMKNKNIFFLAAVVFLGILYSGNSYPCSRVVYQGLNGIVLTARSMDWKSDLMSDLWLFPRGMERNGSVGANSLTWTSKFGSVVTSALGGVTTDGMNEKGLVANILWLTSSQYEVWDGISKPGLSLAAWTQYVLDNYASVDEAVEGLGKEEFVVVTASIDNGAIKGTLHLCVSDTSGDNAIFEYIEGKLVIHHSRKYQVMTNDPVFDKQLALAAYWNTIGGTVMLPGTNKSEDRFVRGTFYINAIPKTDNMKTALASVFSVIRNISAPYGISTPGQPNISSTLWRTVSDHKNKIYYFESATAPNIFWVDFKDADFSEKADVKKLSISKGEIYAGNAVKQFVAEKPYEFLGIK